MSVREDRHFIIRTINGLTFKGPSKAFYVVVPDQNKCLIFLLFGAVLFHSEFFLRVDQNLRRGKQKGKVKVDLNSHENVALWLL